MKKAMRSSVSISKDQYLGNVILHEVSEDELEYHSRPIRISAKSFELQERIRQEIRGKVYG